MSAQVTNYQCPNCTGPLHFDGESGKLKCEYCGSGYSVEEIETLYKEKEEKAAAAQQREEKEIEERKNELSEDNTWDKSDIQQWGTESEDMQAYGAPVVVAFSVLLVPCLDVIRVVLKRARLGHPLFLPDKNHIHHKFLDMGFTPRRALITIQIMSLCFFAFSFIAVKHMDNTLVLVIDIVVWTLLNIWFNKVIIRRRAYNQ